MGIVQKERVNQFDGLYNFRDIGGQETKDGRRMKKGVLFRSDELSRLSQQDIENMKHLQIKLICDLRTPSEQKSKPSRIKQKHGVELVNISIHDKSQEFTHFEFFKFLVGKSHTIDFEKIMKEMYQNIAFSSCHEIKQVIQLLSEQKNVPALIHCTGGKDRTGYIAALIQLLVGIPYEVVRDDYLFSNELIGPRMKKVEKFIRWMSLFQASPERIKPMLEVRPEYLDEVYYKIVEKYGNVEAYLLQACHLEKRSIQNLKQLVLE
ncbi:tyrosine-protein phosphatase [Bacillus sp. XF8]|uniref:tyrosine-protein phosphatase n=1 Tax=Bacillus sp. XF8 TaxID=2819289 RepID=UPI001AA056F5|nr:tyrosine-protein phosphatase [Bacillus sp. XF8]MBO1578483.1 tyrosine-protein phosphatase [Bacillus sp. XF8]